MTYIWDTLGGAAHDLRYEHWDDEKATRVRHALRMVYDAMKDDKQFEQKAKIWTVKGWLHMTNTLKMLTEKKSWEQNDMELVMHTIEGLHDFDHLDLKMRGNPSFGHYTEVMLKRKKKLNEFINICSGIGGGR